jgi:hypothetical protein
VAAVLALTVPACVEAPGMPATREAPERAVATERGVACALSGTLPGIECDDETLGAGR